jgi:hypothetical protein
MTLALCTSAGKLNEDIERLKRRSSHRASAIKNRLSQSKQVQWLRKGRRGTHIFIMKIGQRSRASDWYWEIWRELGGELPTRLDIVVPALSSSVRLLIPEGDEMGGSKAQKELNKDKIVQTCWEMMEGTVDIEELVKQRSALSGGLKLELAWKGTDGSLDWVAWGDTVEGRKRGWAVLASLAESLVSGSSSMS